LRRAASVAMLAFVLVGLLTSALAPVNAYIDVDVSQAKQMINSDPDLVILDVRTQAEYDSGHIQNATLIPVTELTGRLGESDKQKEILVYCASGGRSATASQTLVDNGFSKVYNMLGGITAWKSAGYWIEIVHNGDLIIDGAQTFVIENCTYIQTGNIYVRDYAKLTIRNVALTLNQTYGFQYRFEVGNMATLEMTNLTVSGEEEFGLACVDTSRAAISDSDLWHWGRMFVRGSGGSEIGISNSIGEITLSGDCEVVISNSSFRIQFLLDSNQIGTLEELKPRHYNYWSLHQNQTGVNVGFALTLINTFIELWILRLNYDATIVLSNSAIGILWLNYYYLETTATIHELHQGFYENWSVNTVTLRNTTVDNWFFFIFDSPFELEDSEVLIQPVGNSNISVQDSDKLGFDGISNFNGVLFFNQSSFNLGGIVLESDFYIFGNVTRVSIDIESWVSSNVTRNYNVITTDVNGGLVENAELTLFNKDNEVIWNSSTDSLGQANLNFTFTDANYTDALRLVAVKGNLFATASISLLSATPITLTLGAHDIAATDIAPSKTSVGQGFTLSVNVTVMNKGDFAENFNVTGYANATFIGTQTVFDLSNETSTTLIFNWNTTSVAYGNYTFSSHVWPVQGETRLANNNYTGEYVVVTVPGDINGDFTVDIYDALQLSVAYNSKLSSANWSPNADINGDNVVDIYDAIMLANNYGKTA
jgi:rhodanese-related sulfurtransferase